MIDLGRERTAQRGERGHSDDRGDDQPGEQSQKAEDDAPADRVDPLHGDDSDTIRPPRTVPITTDFAGTSPRSSNAIVPVTPSYAGWPAPTCASRSRTSPRSVPTAANTVASRCTMSYAPAPRWSGRSPGYARA